MLENKHEATLFLVQALDKSSNKEHLQSLMDCIVQTVQTCANNGLFKLRNYILEDKLNKAQEEGIELKNILEFSPIGIAWSSKDGFLEYINHQFIKLFGYTLEDLPSIKTWYEKAYPDIKYQDEVIKPWHEKLYLAKQKGTPVEDLEVTIRCKDQSERRVLLRASWIKNKRIFSFSDITEHWKSEQRNHIHDSMLEMVAKNTSLLDILNTIVKNMEKEEPNSFCSILLLDKDEKHLFSGAAPSLPDFYNDAINGVEIGEGVGSCGSAAYLKTRVIVEDIMNHKYWEPYKSLASSAGLASCWSEPIISSSGKVLGTFAIYHSIVASPNSSDIDRIKFAANLASIAIENRNAKFELERRAYFDYLTDLPNRRYFIEQSNLELSRFHRNKIAPSLLMFDIDHFKQVNDQYGHSIGDTVLQEIANIARLILRDIDLIGRIGGEEFAIVLPQTQIIEATNVAERLRIAISNEKFISNEGNYFYVTASFGVTQATLSANIDDLLMQADQALYEAKNAGRNQVCVYSKTQVQED